MVKYTNTRDFMTGLSDNGSLMVTDVFLSAWLKGL